MYYVETGREGETGSERGLQRDTMRQTGGGVVWEVERKQWRGQC